MSKELEKRNRKKIGEDLRKIREQQGWTTEQVGLMAGVKGGDGRESRGRGI